MGFLKWNQRRSGEGGQSRKIESYVTLGFSKCVWRSGSVRACRTANMHLVRWGFGSGLSVPHFDLIRRLYTLAIASRFLTTSAHSNHHWGKPMNASVSMKIKKLYRCATVTGFTAGGLVLPFSSPPRTSSNVRQHCTHSPIPLDFSQPSAPFLHHHLHH